MVEAPMLPLELGLLLGPDSIWENILGMRITRAVALELWWTQELQYEETIPHEIWSEMPIGRKESTF